MITGIDHATIITNKLDETRDFFVDCFGLEVGQRPSFGVPGYWLYGGGRPILHLALAGPGPAHQRRHRPLLLRHRRSPRRAGEARPPRRRVLLHPDPRWPRDPGFLPRPQRRADRDHLPQPDPRRPHPRRPRGGLHSVPLARFPLKWVRLGRSGSAQIFQFFSSSSRSANSTRGHDRSLFANPKRTRLDAFFA